jgi:hypothetical protein
LNRGLEPTYLIYIRFPDGSNELAGSFFTLQEAKMRVGLLAQKSGHSHCIYDSLKREVTEERRTNSIQLWSGEITLSLSCRLSM